MQLPCLLLGYWWVGAAFANAWFISREHAQREAQVARINGLLVKELKPWQGFTGWDLDRKLDALFPIIVTMAMGVLMEVLGK
jgi:hypothetical protein